MILQEIYVGLSHELFPRDLQAAHQILGDGNSFLFRLIGAKDDFQLHEIAKVLDLIEMNLPVPGPRGRPTALSGRCPRSARLVGTGSSSGLPERWWER